MLLRAAAVWLILTLPAMLYGTVRNFLIAPFVGNGVAHIISSITLSILIFAVGWVFIGWIHPNTSRQALGLGFFRLLLTVLFEFGAGHYLFKNPWEKLLADYNVFKGRVWVLVLWATLLAPYWAARARGLFH
ncbi:MAG: hypothetical protein L0Z48_11395 [candidate division Zixibacteria bacterium]|nr:hypothetical protein [candidate division Zixibacteria bacterium]MCI0597127.1 hypothetical protein [candidate division Zixibacteria bacterium]